MGGADFIAAQGPSGGRLDPFLLHGTRANTRFPKRPDASRRLPKTMPETGMQVNAVVQADLATIPEANPCAPRLRLPGVRYATGSEPQSYHRRRMRVRSRSERAPVPGLRSAACRFRADSFPFNTGGLPIICRDGAGGAGYGGIMLLEEQKMVIGSGRLPDGGKIVELRKRHEIKQADLAKRASISERQLRKIERENVTVPGTTVTAIATALKVSPDEITLRASNETVSTTMAALRPGPTKPSSS